MGLVNFIDTFLEVSQAHIGVNSVGTGDNFQIALTGRDLYPRVWVDQPFQIVVEDNLEINSLKIYIFDLEKKRELWINSIDKCKQIGIEIIHYLRLNYKQYSMSKTYNITSFTEYSDDLLCGVLIEIDVSSTLPINRCDVKNGLFDL
jgi:hypothetical protein